MLLQWYLQTLKTHPYTANLASAALVMSTGDLMAQTVEQHMTNNYDSAARATTTTTTTKSTGVSVNQLNVDDSPALPSPQPTAEPSSTVCRPARPVRTIQFRRYGTMSPKQQEETLQKVISTLPVPTAAKEEDKQMSPSSLVSSWLTESASRVWNRIFLVIDEQQQSTTTATSLPSFDVFRTSTMVTWAIAFYTPFYIAVFRRFHRHFGSSSSPRTVAARVAIMFVSSIPLNAAFFGYGSMVHHAAEWVERVQLQHRANENKYKADYNRNIQEQQHLLLLRQLHQVPFNWNQAMVEARCKLQTELWTTIQWSATLWVPVNTFNFTLVPPHLRPLTLIVCSAGWNCYLSLAQHRPVNVVVQSSA